MSTRGDISEKDVFGIVNFNCGDVRVVRLGCLVAACGGLACLAIIIQPFQREMMMDEREMRTDEGEMTTDQGEMTTDPLKCVRRKGGLSLDTSSSETKVNSKYSIPF